jgi:2-methylaconitate cis-trans-isomerase PrpF
MVWARKRLATAGKPHGTATKTVNPGKALLNAEADKTVRDNRTKIVKALLDSLIECKNMTSAKLLFALADGLINCEDPEVMSQLYSYANSLAEEKQVPAETADAEITEKEKGEQQVSESAH